MMPRLVALSRPPGLPGCRRSPKPGPTTTRRSPTACSTCPPAIPGTGPRRRIAAGRGAGRMRLVFKDRIKPHWFGEGTRFWYRNDLPRRRQGVHPGRCRAGDARPAFDHEKLAAPCRRRPARDYHGRPAAVRRDRVRRRRSRRVRFRVGDATWKCDLTRTTARRRARTRPCRARAEGRGRRRNAPATVRPPPGRRPTPTGPARGPAIARRQVDRLRQGPQRLRPRRRARRGGPAQQGRQGGPGLRHALLVARLEDAGRLPHRAGRAQGGPPDRVVAAGRRPGQLQSRPYPLPGDKFTAYELNLFDVADQQADQARGRPHRLRPPAPALEARTAATSPTRRSTAATSASALIEVDAHTGKARNLIDEKTETFIWTAHAENVDLPSVNWLEKTDEIIYASERDGWRHLYLYRRQGRADQEPDHQGRVRRPRHRPHRRGRRGRSGSAPAA